MKIKNLFNIGIIDKDSQGRFVSEGKLIDAENFFVNTLEGSSGGVAKNALGNALKTAYNITGGKTIGHGVNTSNGKVYNFIKGTNHDYIIEYDSETSISAIVAQSATGTRLNFKTGERIANVDVIVSGEPYDAETKQGGDLMAFSGDSNPPRLINIERFKANHALLGIGWFTEEEISVMKPAPLDAPTLVLTTSATGIEDFLNDKFICFAYRYKYNDNLFSAFSPWSEVAFSPDSFKMDYQTYDNKGMLNVFNAVDVSYNTGVRSVLEVQLLMRESSSSIVYIVDKFKKTGNNITQTFQFDNSKVYLPLPEAQYTRSFDNVPLQAGAQTIFGNRLGYANYLEGRNITEDVDFDLEILSEDVFSDTLSSVVENHVDTALYSNLIDFESGLLGGGTTPEDYMNFATNNTNFTLSAGEEVKTIITVTPRETFGSSVYKIVIRNGATLVTEWTGLTGIHTVDYTHPASADLTYFVYSANGLIYDAALVFKKQTTFPIVKISEYTYSAVSQLSYPNSTGVLTSLEGNTIIKRDCVTDLSTFAFESGKQLRFNFTLKSSLNEDNVIDITFPYTLTSNYSNLADFIANSSFKSQIEGAFSTLTFKPFMTSGFTEVSFIGFTVSIPSTGYLKIRTPKAVYNVLENSGITEHKNDFYLIYEYETTVTAGLSYASLHSNRDLEVCMVYLDGEGRETTALICPTNTIHIPAEKSITINKLKINVNNTPPVWAKAYRFGIKQAKRDYETLYGNLVYTDGLYRWISIVGENKNKVKEGDELILKSDFSGALTKSVKVKVLEAGFKDVNFIERNNLTVATQLTEKSGYYIKIKQGNFSINVDEDAFKEFSGFNKSRYPARDNTKVSTNPIFGEVVDGVWKPYEIASGSQITINIVIDGDNLGFRHELPLYLVAAQDYPSIKEFFDAQVVGADEWTLFSQNNGTTGFLKNWGFDSPTVDGVVCTNSVFWVTPWRDGAASKNKRISTYIKFDVVFSQGNLIFETNPIVELNTPFYKTPETFKIVNGAHNSQHILNRAFNCFSFGNGAESNRIRDAFNENSFSIDSSPTAVSEVAYKQIRRFADITYSGGFNSNSNVNKLNEFNLSLANYKEDIDKSYGNIVKIKGTDSNIEVYQEDKCSKVYYGKDVLYNADGSSNLTKIESVLGQQEMYGGEYGISYHAESFDEYAFNSYLTDTKRGIVLKKSNNGLFEISSQGMNSYFKKLFRDNVINQIIGEYDQHHDVFVLNIKYNSGSYVTWVYSDKDNGWLGRLPFNPEDMCRVNGKFLSFKNGEIYQHNDAVRNTFYGVETPSTFTINFPQDPSSRKNYKTIEIEGTDAWDLTINTDFDAGYVNAVDFNKEEGVYKAHTRLSNTVIDTSLLSVQGIGNCTVTGLVLNFGFNLSSDISIGDNVRNLTNQLVGTITAKTATTLTLNAVANIVSGDYVMCSKPQSANVNNLLGYHLQVSGSLSKNTKTELFAVNAEIVKSFN